MKPFLCPKYINALVGLEFQETISGDKERETGTESVGRKLILTERIFTDVHNLNVGIEKGRSHNKTKLPETRPGGGLHPQPEYKDKATFSIYQNFFYKFSNYLSESHNRNLNFVEISFYGAYTTLLVSLSIQDIKAAIRARNRLQIKKGRTITAGPFNMLHRFEK